MKLGNRGQTQAEYIIIIAVITSIALLMIQTLKGLNLDEKITEPIQGQFKRTYQHGHPKATGYEDGGPDFHPRATQPVNKNFRIFINPGANS